MKLFGLRESQLLKIKNVDLAADFLGDGKFPITRAHFSQLFHVFIIDYKRGALNDRGPLMTITLGCTKPSKYWPREKVIGRKVSCLDSLCVLVLLDLG